MDKDVFTVRPPSTDAPGKYILLLTRAMGMMGAAKHAAFYVDGVRAYTQKFVAPTAGQPFESAFINGDPPVLEGYIDTVDGQQVITAFPVGTMFLMLPRDQVTPQTDLEVAQEEAATHDVVGAFLRTKAKEEADKEEAEAGPRPKLHTGQYN